LIFADASRLESTASILSFFLLILDVNHPLHPMDLKVANEGFHIVVPSKGATSPQEFSDFEE
jgi:hypothetical protein